MTKVEYKHTHIAAKKKLGQNFLTDRNIPRKIVRESGIAPGDRVLEIGPGFGALSTAILEVMPSFTAVEKDHELAAFIRQEHPGIDLIEGDFLKVPLEPIADGGKIAVLGNIPYSITSPILFRLLDNRHLISSATLMMQHEVALRLAAEPGTKEYGILAVQMQAFCDVKYLFKVGRAVFKPRPEVDSAVIRMVPRAEDPVADSEGFRTFVRCAFRQRRKTLLNNLKDYYDTSEVKEETLKLRAEALTISELISLFSLLRPVSPADKR
ncbi:MAG: 16S rRNA (adenine(1518)-N(6)/adenine(1519)-N(6))-dimethyltransferase RsmA [Chlorobiaceae bacterium]|nr:16S rRNA (adenine(1518)-N(6)/adenine(1519)-N(6))-dimethyltransferase RsmA [Chlorobiales bacterium]NTU91782.1 16S rRNA (adenine(1518)-N(6)/adenine(1519)-N(6))-dimethyltransferase RsmA [Chlorobiaceae bacterium]NTV26515.1 16S rRNA (adenine(1518)-N(6)/adenine(1519)-N(6))-dimethyltransferase RsmA [Chlorobiaceae bacterium]